MNHYSELVDGLICPLFSMEAQRLQVENLASEMSEGTNGNDFLTSTPFAQVFFLPPQTPFGP